MGRLRHADRVDPDVMTDLVVESVSREGFATTSRAGDFRLTVDATDETGPNPNAVLLADYASCYVPALRVSARHHGHDDLGRLEIDVAADLDERDDLAAIRFSLRMEADLDEEELASVVAYAKEICHVNAALREGLRADVTARADAF